MEKEEFIRITKEKGLEVALAMSARQENKDWKCPICKSPVKIAGQESYETLSEHVTDPNATSQPKRDAYKCTNQECICNDSKHDVFWSYNGEMYGGFMIDDEEFIGENNAPFGSFERKMNVEIGKDGLKSEIYLHPAWCLWLLQPYIEYHYKGDVMGNVVKKWFTVEFLKKNERGEYSYKFSTCWSTWKHKWFDFYSKIKAYKEHKQLNVLKSAFKPAFNRAWDHRWFEGAMKILFWRYYKKVK
jgi:hypothetical protein